MEKFWIGLLENRHNAFDILCDQIDDPSLRSLVKITRNLRGPAGQQETISRGCGKPLLHLSKSIYFWFINLDEAQSVEEMRAFSLCSDWDGVALEHMQLEHLELHPNFTVERFLELLINVTTQSTDELDWFDS